jgi:demethylmenaquinone methyltransferase/2-methoxy-6-polyprenyl-1,4-benzoquinol methylase
MFGEIAPAYDRMNHLLSMNVDHYWRWRTTRLVPAVGSDPILDCCTGTGDLAFAYHSATRGKTPIVATDFCPEMLAIGEEKRKRRRIEGIEFREADAEALPFPNDHFQIVCVAFGLRNVANTDQGLREMTRVCMPGGKVAVLEFSLPTHQPMKWLYSWYFRNVLPRIGQWLARNNSSAYSYLPESVGQFPMGEALCERMRAAGMRSTRFYPLTFGIATLYVGEK